MKYIIFHHDDLDGYASGYITKKSIKDESADRNIVTFVCNYEKNSQKDILNKADIRSDDIVYIVDYCFEDKYMKILFEKLGNNLIWIDHHSTAIERMKDYNINGIRDTKFSATKLCWNYFFSNVKEPIFVQLIDIFDCWKKNESELWDWNISILPFKYALEHENLDLYDNNNVWNELIKNDPNFIRKLLIDGTVIKNYVDKKYIEEAKNKSYVIEFEGCRALTINSYGSGSLPLEETFDPSIHDIMLTYSIGNNKLINVGLYTTKKDFHVGNIAKKFGGGGHPGAAGFSLPISELNKLI